MRRNKKLVSVLLCLVMTVLLATPALAAEGTYFIVIQNDAAGHTYEAYQIFAGDLSADGVLSNIVWGAGVDGEALLGALQAADAGKYGGCTSAVDVAEALGGGEQGEATAADAEAFAKVAENYLGTPTGSANTPEAGQYTIGGLPAGYYLVKDRDNSLEGSQEAYTNYIVQVVANVEMAPKSGVTTSEKKVKDINDSEGTTYTDWQDAADYDIGDRIPFQLKATLPANYSTYSEYALVFHDTESAGLTFQRDSVQVFIDGHLVDEADYSIVTTGLSDGLTFEIRIDNLKAITAAEGAQAGNNSVVTVEYESVLNENAAIGSAGNPNTMYLTFFNNPNGTGTGRTQDDTVIVFTYKVVVNKVDGENAALPGAEFTLEKKQHGETGDTWETVQVLGTDGTMTAFSFDGLDDGDYRLSETKTPEGYNTIAPIEFTITATHDIVSNSPALTGLEATNARYVDAEGGTIDGLVTFTRNTEDDDGLTTTVVNNSGATLPETGGIGTTIFYVLGGILVIGAGVLLVARRRMRDQ